MPASRELLIADEPTTALDVTIQKQILELLDDLKARLGMAMILITHDLGVIAGRADKVVVMYAGKIVEQAETLELFERTRHPYTEALLASIPQIDQRPTSPCTPFRACRQISPTRLRAAGSLPAAPTRQSNAATRSPARG